MLRHSYRGVLGGVAGAVMECLTEMRYRAVVQVVNMADYGIPQQRERVLIIASRDGQVFFPSTTHSETPARGKRAWATVSDAISDLPRPPVNTDKLGGGPTNLYLSSNGGALAQSLRSRTCFPFNHITRKYNSRIIDIIGDMRPGETWDSASTRMQSLYADKINQTRKPGEDHDQTLDRLAKEGFVNKAFYRHYYWSAYTRLAWDRPALTITANANFLGSGRFTHPEQNRGITMREAARLQTFQDDFAFITSPEGSKDTVSIGVGMDMIGEAVPPHFALVLAEHVACLLSGNPAPESEFQMALFEKHEATHRNSRAADQARHESSLSGKKPTYGHQRGK
jgi:DNA (cytosine-5)-methyltransferase 1